MLETTLAVAVFLAAGMAPAQEHHDRAPSDPFTLKPLAGNVHALYGRGGKVDLPAYKAFSGYPDRFRANAAAAFDEAP